ncbi:YbhB/YbcL family Raf kinase inhibitor-like protein [Glaciimonas sp. GS1]|uniref:YbhB/YbcL family Raf kinase inhibitor-like protein n=2 Tax=Glaciimonas soli TaxID=2590999 RepID=A0A843YUP8_9BURK|nr:YbhB/YbcL family Raf kinase inhibitor-like protein [Glaciimonas soli]
MSLRQKVQAFAVFSASVLVAVPALSAGQFQVSSDDVKNGRLVNEQVLNGFGCNGGNVSPHIVWSGVPKGSKSLLVTIHDPDAPTDGLGWTHWVIANIPPTITELAKGISIDSSKLPAGAVQTNTDFGKAGYGGPCPPVGSAHRYIVTVNALKVEKLAVDANSTPALVAFMANGQSLGKASFTSLYQRAN